MEYSLYNTNLTKTFGNIWQIDRKLLTLQTVLRPYPMKVSKNDALGAI